MGADETNKKMHPQDVDAKEVMAQEAFRERLRVKYDSVFDEPIPERLADLIARLRELKSN